MNRPLRIGTRGSPLALAQAHMVAAALRSAHGWDEDRVEIVPITTTGDVVQDRPLAEIGGKGLWTKELDRCLAAGDTDLSVHSMKDVETIRADSLAVAAMLPRADVRDRLIGAPSIAAIAQGAVVGTSSPRRAAQLLRRRPDLQVVPIRGNVETRLRKVAEGEVAASLLAAAGLDRIGRGEVGTPVEDMLPAPSQGAVGIEVLAGNAAVRDLVAAIDHPETHACVRAERRLLLALGGDCRSAVAALATMTAGRVTLRAEILTADGREVEAGETAFDPADGDAPAALGRLLLDRASPALRAMFAG
ncbi:MAG: hydroxymethylbilane synthase [Allosphingosinicella sp.]|uniref:hydroxymethylbilane synthase n=1 Tax=Allosphingosinicella sp. TaxID=2823234 RepID=UPI003963EC32